LVVREKNGKVILKSGLEFPKMGKESSNDDKL